MLLKNIGMIPRCGLDPSGGAIAQSLVPQEGLKQKVQSSGRGHIGNFNPLGRAIAERI
jgi:hypothetical protein